GMGLAQLRKAETMWRRRVAIAQRYSRAFAPLDELILPAERDDCQHDWPLYMVRLNLDRLRIGRGEFVEELRRHGIGASVHFIPLHVHPYYRDTYCYSPDEFPVSYHEYLREVSLPIYSKMEESDVEYVVETVMSIIQAFHV
ncbi:DegT/DnrJ/EryC1/StrS aminotransferase family protein, partial [bacterium]